jgi:hypothetical protein
MMNRLKPLFYNGTGRQKGIPKGVDETHLGRKGLVVKTLICNKLFCIWCFFTKTFVFRPNTYESQINPKYDISPK